LRVRAAGNQVGWRRGVECKHGSQYLLVGVNTINSGKHHALAAVEESFFQARSWGAVAITQIVFSGAIRVVTQVVIRVPIVIRELNYVKFE
jgi:hypothetical protein